MPKIGPKINKIEIWLKSGLKVINLWNESPTAQNAPRNHGKPYAPYPPATRLSSKSPAHLHPEPSHVPTLRLSGERVYNTSSGSVLWLSRLFHPALLLQLIQTAPVARSQLHSGSILYLYLNPSILYLYLYFYPVNSNRLSRTFWWYVLGLCQFLCLFIFCSFQQSKPPEQRIVNCSYALTRTKFFLTKVKLKTFLAQTKAKRGGGVENRS